jgi:hypothetical protein
MGDGPSFFQFFHKAGAEKTQSPFGFLYWRKVMKKKRRGKEKDLRRESL